MLWILKCSKSRILVKDGNHTRKLVYISRKPRNPVFNCGSNCLRNHGRPLRVHAPWSTMPGCVVFDAPLHDSARYGRTKWQGFFNPRHINLHQFVAEIPVSMPIFISGRSAQNCVMAKRPRTIAGLGAAQRKDNGWSWDLTQKTNMVNGCFLGTRPFESFRSSEPLWMDDQSSYCWVIHGQGGAFPQDLRKRSKFKRSTGVLQPTSHKFTSVCGWNSGANANLHQQSVSPKLCGKILATSVQLMHICFFRRRHATWKSEKSNEIFWDMSDMWLPMFHRIGWWENWNRKARSIWW